ncbi:MAG: hypothetical protein IJU30_05485, partial [Lachnospiraceae bacterium]|nr:hypothetical protein [Lachnospiraceae bacterium]
PKDFYLPLDPLHDRPDVESQMGDPGSLLQFVRDMITFRKEHGALQADGDFRFLTDGHVAPLVYERYTDANGGEGERLVLAFNPSAETVQYALRGDASTAPGSMTPDSSAFCLIREYGGSDLDASGILTLPAGSFVCVEYKSR